LPHHTVRDRRQDRHRKAPLIAPGSQGGSAALQLFTPGLRNRIGTRRRQGRATPRRGQNQTSG
ncbi:MAG: hypothetical protein WBP70_05535, partial [Terriglobales bacterium]